MILDALANAQRYAALHPLFSRAFDYIRATELSVLAPGRYDIAGDELFAIVERASGRTREQAQLECHRKYIDIQLVLQGVDEMGWKPLADCRDPVSDYSAERDILFFSDAPAAWVSVPSGYFCIFFPEDAHAPLVGAGEICKVIVKVAASGMAGAASRLPGRDRNKGVPHG